jgi:methylated-DNA-[protein]-cysteine S-methyltransferase
MSTRHAIIDSPLGALTLVAEGDALAGVYFPHHWYRPTAESLGPRVETESDALISQARIQLTDYFSGARTDFDVSIAIHGSPLQNRVATMLAAIPHGETITYGELATALGDGTTAREVGQIVGRNPLSIVIPCHRVVGRNGQLTGYAGGLARKQFLLELEEPAEVKEARLF